MLNHELHLISAIIQTKDLATVEKLKITEDFFQSRECQAAFKYLRKYNKNSNTYGHIPSTDIFLNKFTGFPLVQGELEPLEVLCNEVREKYLTIQLEEAAERLMLCARNRDPYGGLNFFREKGISLVSEHDVNDDLTLAGSGNQIMDQYRESKERKGILGFPWPWVRLNEITQGIQKGHLIYIRAQTGTGKTMTTMAACVNAYKHFNARVLVYSLEMKNIEINTIAACYYGNIDLLGYYRGTLSPHDERRLEESVDILAREEMTSRENGARNRAWLTTSGEGTTGISSLKSKIIEFDPDIVVIDGVYLLFDEKSKKSDSDWKTIVNISRSLKSMQKELKIRNPIRDFCMIGIIQSDKDDEIAMAKYVKQDCDISMLLQAGWDDGTNSKYIRLVVDKVRKGKPGDVFMNYVPGLDWSEREPPVETKQAPSKKRSGFVAPNLPVFGGVFPTYGS